MAVRDKLARLRALAAEKGFRLERAFMRDRWRLTDEATGKLALNKNGSAAFTLAEAMGLLGRRK